MNRQRKKDQKLDKLFRNSRPTTPERLKESEIVYCRRCGERLTSERSRRLGIGQRCKWQEDEENGTRVFRGPHMKEDVDFKTQGQKVKSGVVVRIVQTQLGDF